MNSDEYGTLDRFGDLPVVRFTRRFAHPIDTVWRALTEPEHLAQWFPTTIEGDRSAGAPLRFTFSDIDLPAMEGEMIAFEPPRLIEFRWFEDILRFELEPVDDHGSASTLLKFSATFIEIGKVARDGAGWHACLDLLHCAVEGSQPPWTSPDRWRLVHGEYIARFGPEASTIGPPGEWEDVYGPA